MRLPASFVWPPILALLLSLGLAASASADLAPFPPEIDVCEAPISTCAAVIAGDDRLTRPEIYPPPDVERCPPGYTCTCVPSCPECDDCAAEVCVRGKKAECRTACDCEPGLACYEGRCIAGFAPVFCCEDDVCPAGQQCQHPDGRMDRCEDGACVDALWTCPEPGSVGRGCGDDRVCSCIASCQFCEDCGGGVCTPRGLPTPYRCGDDGACGTGDRCVCVSSCPDCDDCADAVCVPKTCGDPACEDRVRKVQAKIKKWVHRTNACERAEECVRIDTSTECRGTCGAWVNAEYTDKLRRKIRRLDERVCGTYQEDGCPFATPACAFERPACVRGHCQGVFTEPTPLPLPMPMPPDATLVPGDRLDYAR